MVLVYLLTAVILWAWLMRSIKEKKVVFRRTPWDIPLIFFLISQIISTIISIDRHTSLLGYYSRFHGGLLSTICYLTLYWGLVSNLKKEDSLKLIRSALFSGLLVSLYGIGQHFGIDKNLWIQDVQNRVFSTLGQPNWLAAYLDLLIFIVLAHYLFSPPVKTGEGKKTRIISLGFFSIYYLCLLFTKSRSGFLGFVFPLLILLSIELITGRLKRGYQKIISLLLITGFLSALIGIPFNLKSKINLSFLSDVDPVPSQENQEQPQLLITPSSDIRRIVWQGAVELWKKHPFFGTGVETFGYAYYWTRPAEHNLTSEWDFLYNKAHNEYLNFAATSGSFGLISYLSLPVLFLIFTIRRVKEGEGGFISLAGLTAFASLMITNFFGFSVVPVAIFFFLLPAITFVQESKEEFKEISLKWISQPFLEKIKIIPLVLNLFFLFSIFKITRYWLADFHFSRGSHYQKGEFLDSALKELDQAVRLNSSEPNFYAKRATVYAKIVAALVKNKQNEEAKEFVPLAVADSQKALKMNPYHINFYKNQARVFYYLAFYQLDYLKLGLETLKTAEELAPTDPKITYNIGLIYQTLDEKDKAEEYFKKTLELKPNYDAAKKALEGVQGNSL